MLADVAPVHPLAAALQNGFGLIAEIKECSPSHGAMRRQNVDEAPSAYEQSSLVRAISILTNGTHFGMNMERLRQAKLDEQLATLLAAAVAHELGADELATEDPAAARRLDEVLQAPARAAASSAINKLVYEVLGVLDDERDLRAALARLHPVALSH